MDVPDLSLGLGSLDLSSLDGAARPEPDATHDLVIAGGGPAAMTAAVYAARKMMKVALVAESFGGQMTDTSEIENYTGFQTITGAELTARFTEHVRSFDLPILQGQKVAAVTKEGDIFGVALEDGSKLASRTVIVATGKRSRPLGVPGERELVGRGVAYCAICDAPFYRGKRVVVAGGGNSAFTAALDLLKIASAVTMVNFARGWQADGVLRKSVEGREKLTLMDNHEVTAIEGERKVAAVRVKSRATGEERSLPADGIFVEIGLIPNSDLVKGLAGLNDAGELVVDCRCRTSVEGLFGAGDVTTVPHKQIVISAGEGAKAALSAYDYLAGRGLL